MLCRLFGFNPVLSFSLAACFIGCSTTSIERGVGNNPDPISVVVRAKFASWYTVPFRIVPDLGNVEENSLKPSPVVSTNESCDVFKDCVIGSNVPK